MDRIQRVSNWHLIIFNFLLIYLPLEIICYWTFIDSSFVSHLAMGPKEMFFDVIPTPEGLIHLSQVHWTLAAKAIAFMGDLLNQLPLFLGLFSLKAIFSNYRKGAIFTIDNAKHYRRLGLLLFLNALIARPIAGMLTMLGITFANASGHRLLTINFGTPNLSSIFLGFLLMVISWVMLEASRLEEENKLIV